MTWHRSKHPEWSLLLRKFRTTFLPALTLLLVASLTAPLTAQPPNPVARRTAIAKPSEAPSTQLPVTRVSLYKNGVGFFEHAGRVTGNQSITIDFTSAYAANRYERL